MSATPILYIGLLCFVSGIAIRILRIATMPVHVRWELYPLPESSLGKARVMLSEILLLRGVYENHRALWLWSWLFHLSLYMTIGVACVSLVASISTAVREQAIPWMEVLPVIAFAVGTVGTCGLVVMRIASRRMRTFTSFAAVLNLILLLAIFVTGLAYACLIPGAARTMVMQAGSLLGRNSAPPLDPLAAAHLFLAAFFIAYFPFTQMAHAVLKYFTYHSVRWDDRPVGQLPEYAARMRRYLAFPMNWSAPHIRKGTTKPNWSEAVSAEDLSGDTDDGQGART
jgi:nitrate reductase gamma subunit